MATRVELDGSEGEGGGQILRTALALSLVTGRPFQIVRIRAFRKNPGLARQHLAAVAAAAAISGGRAEGAALGATELAFEPGDARPGRYRFEIGSAGSVALLLHTLYLPLSLAAGASELVLTGGTHVPWSPSFEYLEGCWAPLVRRLGLRVALDLERAGFYPPGGGRLRVRIAGGDRPRAAAWDREAAFRGARGISLQAGLREEVAARQARAATNVLEALGALRARGLECPIALGALEADSPGTTLALFAEAEQTVLCATALGARGKRAETVGAEAARDFLSLLEARAPLDPHAAEQLLLPLALAEGESRLLTGAVSAHLTTNARVIERFLPVAIAIDEDAQGRGLVRIAPGRAAPQDGGAH